MKCSQNNLLTLRWGSPLCGHVEVKLEVWDAHGAALKGREGGKEMLDAERE